ncbi:MAG TPA: GDP-mannose 4,6-dehydratase [Herpetosiphonaceae bacterium]|nr:GDP-mannose 4,6-dehydratase [Herpetosiphonaceae bacterium]
MSDYRDFYSNRNVMITGGLGFLGSNLAHTLVELGAKVLLVDPMLPLYGGNYFNVESIRDLVRVNIADIRDAGAMNELVKGQDVIYHIGNQTSHVDSMTDPLLDVDINCRGNIIFLEACRQFAPEAKIVYAGTRGQYGRLQYVPVDEKHPSNPTDVYGINKHAGEQYMFTYGRIYGMPVTSLRINNSYGPRGQMKHGKYGILNWFLRLAMDGKPIQVYGEGQQLRDYNYVDDVTDAFLRVAATEKSNGEAYNLGSNEHIKFIDLVRRIVAAAGSGSVEQIAWPEDRAAIEIGDYAADIAKIQTELGWQPTVTLAQGLERTVGFYREHKQHYW